MEVIHRFNGHYPFGMEKQSEQTYVQLLKENLSEQQINEYRLKNKILKEIESLNIIKLTKIYKEERNLHLIYEYYPTSFESYIDMIAHKAGKKIDPVVYRGIITNFIAAVNHIIELLIHYQIKTDLLINCFAVAETSGDNFITIKVFIDPDCQCLGLHLPFSTEQHEVLKQRVQQNRAYLQQIYEAQRKRLMLELGEMVEHKYGHSEVTPQVNQPNFVINGSKLVFVKNQQKRDEKDQQKSSIIQEPQQPPPERRGEFHSIENKYEQKQQRTQQTRAEKLNQAKKQLKDKNLKKIQEIKQNLNHLSQKNHNVLPVHQVERRHSNQHQQQQQQLMFKPEQISKQKPANLQEKQYLQSLQDQLQKMNNSKRLKDQRIKQERVKQERLKNQKSKQHKQYKQIKQEKITQDAPHLVSVKSQEIKPIEKKGDEKMNKYKMKIITSHEIEIEGAADQDIKEVEKDIVEGIKSGKINMNDLGNMNVQKASSIKIQQEESPKKNEEKTHPNIHNNNIQNSQINQNSSGTQSNQNNQHNQMIQQQIQQLGEEQLKLNNRSSDIASKSKKISQIIQKINSKNSQHNKDNPIPENKGPSTPIIGQHKQKIMRHNTVNQPQHQQNYFDKIKQAKNKAEQVLRQYAKAKKQ